MGWSITLGTIRGTAIRMHLTFLLLVGLYAWSGYRLGGPVGAGQAVGLLLALFACVLAHEFGHILMAGHYGVRTPDVLLLPIGGVARLERMPDEPRQEFFIALAGPLVTLAIVVALYGVIRLTGGVPVIGFRDVGERGFLDELMRINAWLLLFNLLPAFPMDGGRVLRSLLAARLGLGRATRIAASIGQGLAFLMGLVGLTTGNAILALIGFFIFLGAASEASAVQTKLQGSGLTVGDMMITDFRALPRYAPLRDAVNLLLAGEQREFPVVDHLGAVTGILTRDLLIKALADRGPESSVEDAMRGDIAPLAPDLGFEPALERLRATGLGALPVVDGRGALVGLLTMDNVTDLLLVRGALRRA